MPSKWTAHTLASVLAAVFFLQVHFGSLEKSLTWDEPVYIAAGYIYLERGYFHLNPAHPPLLQYLAALPLLFLEPQVPRHHRALNPNNNANRIVDFAKQFIFHPENDVRRIAYWARLSRHILGTFLILAIYLWGRRLYGDGPALFAAAVAAFCPNLIAHAKLATEDLGCAAFVFFSVWAFWHSTRAHSVGPWLLCGLVTGLALVTKYTALLLAPIYAVLMLVIWIRDPDGARVRRDLLHAALAGVTAVLVVGAAYDLSFNYGHYINGLTEIYKDMKPDSWYYFFGEAYYEPKWYYCVVAAVIKTPLSTLLLVGLASVIAISDRRHREAQLFLLVPAAAVITTSFFDSANLGLRRILPAFPFIILFTAQCVAGTRHRLRLAVAGVALALTIVSAVRVYPHHLSYFNEAVGGPERGPYLLIDSDLDWGQDLPALAKWQQSHPEARPIKLAYFGLADPASYGVASIPIGPSDPLTPAAGFYAVSGSMLAYLRKVSQEKGMDVDWLEKYEPIDRAGYSIYIYRFPPEHKASESQ